MAVQVKLCGLNSAESVEAAGKLGADYAGFIFYPPSPRAVGPDDAAEWKKLLPAHVQTVAVTVNMADGALDHVCGILQPDWIQLHGSETPERATQIKARTGRKIIKAIPIGMVEDLALMRPFLPVVDALLFDAKPPPRDALPGGNGLAFDWHMLQGLALPKLWFLAGGLGARNIREALAITHAPAVDVSSGIESEPGVKDLRKMSSFMSAVRGALP